MNVLIRALLVLFVTITSQPVQGQTAIGLVTGSSDKTAQEAVAEPLSEKDIQELLRLLSNPNLAEHLRQQLAVGGGIEAEGGLSGAGLQAYFQATLTHVEQRAGAIADALLTIPQLSSDLSAAWAENMTGDNFLQSAIYVIIFLFGGFGLEWLYWAYLSGTLKRIELSNPKTYGSVFRAAVLRAVLRFGSIAVFALGSMGLFAGFEWSAFIEHISLSLLAGIIAWRFINMMSVFVLAPNVDELRLLPLDKQQANHAYRWILLISGTGLLGYMVDGTIERLAIGQQSMLAIGGIAGLVFVAVMIAAIWQTKPIWHGVSTPSSGDGSGHDSETGELNVRVPQNIKPVLLSVVVILVFILSMLDVNTLMWTVVIAATVMPVIALSRIMVDHVFDRVEEPARAAPEQDAEELDDEDQTLPTLSRYELYRPIVGRLIRFFLIIIAMLLLGMVWDVTSMVRSASSSAAEKLFGVLIDIVFALLIADLVWTWAKTVIDRKMSAYVPPDPGHIPGPGARMATLLPMFRKVLMITMMIMVTLIILSSLGVNIAPILAGAGVVGIALGFGAQALVKDIVSGVFFLIDDAFRVGEYIEMGDLRGTVEGVSVRSLRVRHHRGGLHSIPFGEIKSMTNDSRDWALIKMEFRVPFDTDLKMVKKIVKKIGASLSENPDYGEYIIAPLKSQGVRRMEEFNMVIGVKFTAVPGQQWTIRRDAFQQIRDAFDAQGIKLAQRNVTVEVVSDKTLSKEEEEAVAGAAHDSIEQQLPGKPLPDEP